MVGKFSLKESADPATSSWAAATRSEQSGILTDLRCGLVVLCVNGLRGLLRLVLQFAAVPGLVIGFEPALGLAVDLSAEGVGGGSAGRRWRWNSNVSRRTRICGKAI
jgi:hypothetical protein